MSGDQNDDELFRRTMAELGVTRAAHRPEHQAVDRRPVVRNDRGALSQTSRQSVRAPATASIDQTHPSESVLFVRSGVPSARVKQLRRGQITLQESLDLHGMRSAEAEAALERFLDECIDFGLYCVLLIHGKGRGSEVPGGILKPLALHWLKQQGEVQAFCEALPEDGGSGALYLLLNSKG